MVQTVKTISVTVPQLIWWGDIDAELTFPGDWDIVPCYMQGHNAPKLDDKGYRKAFANPIGTKPIRELARVKRMLLSYSMISAGPPGGGDCPLCAGGAGCGRG
jgi:hypothetical protein